MTVFDEINGPDGWDMDVEAIEAEGHTANLEFGEAVLLAMQALGEELSVPPQQVARFGQIAWETMADGIEFKPAARHAARRTLRVVA